MLKILSGKICLRQCNNCNVSICVGKISYYEYGKVCLWTDLFKMDIFKYLMIRHCWKSHFLLIPSKKKSFLTNKYHYKLQCCLKRRPSAANILMYFPWPPRKARLSITTFGFLFTSDRKLLFYTYCLWLVHLRRKLPSIKH